MTISVDLEAIRMLTQLSRDSIDMKVPMLDEFKLHFMKNRRRILENYRMQAVGMSMALSALKSNDNDAGLAALKQEVELYQAWVLEEIHKIDALKEEAK